jgi:hypothetical protein
MSATESLRLTPLGLMQTNSHLSVIKQTVNPLNHRVGIRIFGLTNCGFSVKNRRAMHATFNKD